MPSTPRVYAVSPNDGSVPRNVLDVTAKDHLLSTRAISPLLGKEVSPFSGAGIRYESTLGTDFHSEAKLRAARQGTVQEPSTSQLPIAAPRNGIKEEALEEGLLKQAVESFFTPCFKTSRTRAWEKSRKIEESDWMLTREELDEQLRPEEEGLVPLNAIAGRMVLYGWQLFANQIEINASLSPLKRRKRIYDDAHEARKQLIKLLVLVQWSTVAPELKIARSLIAFINDHFVQTDAAVNALAETRSILANARLRSYDLVTAIEALGTGSPQRIPPILKGVVQAHKTYTNAETTELVNELEEAIRLRLACEEVIPMSMTSYTIGDGRARFRVPMLFEADLTLSGSANEDRWWLMRIRFDFEVTGEGADRFPRQPKKQQRLTLLSLADAELAPRSVAALTEQSAVGDAETRMEVGAGGDIEMGDVTLPLALDDQGPAKRKDAPLVRLYNLIQSQALRYWLDILHYQAVQQVNLGWGRRLSVQMEASQRSRALHIVYWQQLDTDAPAGKNLWRPTASGKLIISIREKSKENGFEKVLKQLSTSAQEEDSEHGRGQMEERLEVHVEWDVQSPTAEYLASRRVIVDAQDLNARNLLLDVTSRHSEASIKAIKARIASSSLTRLVAVHESCQLSARGLNEHLLHLKLNERFVVALRIDQTSGHIQLEQAGDPATQSLTSHDWLHYLRDTSAKINERPDQIVPILQSVRSRVILEDLQEKSSLLGISVTTRMPLRQRDYAQLKARPGTLMYIALKQCPGYYLVIHIGEESIRVALLCTGTFLEDLITSVRIISLEWLDWQRVISSSENTNSTLGKRKREESLPANTLTRQELAKLYSYSVALICYHKVEQQLRAQGLSFVHVGGWTKVRAPPLSSESLNGGQQDDLDSIVPSLCLNAAKILHSSNVEITNRNVSIRLQQWWEPSKAIVIISIRLKLTSGLVVKESILETKQERIQYNLQSSILSFSFRDINNCLSLFLTSWRHIDRILDLNRELTRARQKDFYSVIECDLVKVRFAYANDYVAEVRWVRNVAMQRGGHYSLAFESKEPSRGMNPHRVIKTALAQWLNSNNDSSTSTWPDFLQILRQTLSLLEHVCLFSEQCYESIDCPELDIQGVVQFRLIFLGRYELEVRLLTAGNKVLFSDGVSRKSAISEIKPITKDEFSLVDDNQSITSPITASKEASANAIPLLQFILSDLLSQFRQEHHYLQDGNQDQDIEEDKKKDERASRLSTLKFPILVFSNALLCPNEPIVIDWFLPRLIKRIQEAID